MPLQWNHKSITESDSPYTLTASDNVIACNHSSAITINLPATSATPTGKIFTIKDESGSVSTNNITVTPNGADTIEGTTSVTINGDYNAIEIYVNDSTGWFIK